MGVGANDILAAARAGGATAAGTSCGSCRPEVAALLARAPRPVAAE
jgi:assimilatory nitrate reductase catalytic subunit